jgi:hypothetical protein
MNVIDDQSVPAGQPYELALQDLLNTADATVAYVSSDLPSAFVAQEIDTSYKLGKPTLVVTSSSGPLAGVSSDIEVVRFGRRRREDPRGRDQ